MPVILLTVKVAFILLVVGLIIFCVGFFSPFWTYREIHTTRNVHSERYMDGYTSYGLWTYCRDTEEYFDQRTRRGLIKVDDCWSLINNPHLLNVQTRVSQFFETVGLLLVIASIILLLLAVLVGSCKVRKILPILSAVFCLSAASIILGTIIYGTAELHKQDLSWAFALAITGGVIFFIAGILIVVGGVLKK